MHSGRRAVEQPVEALLSQLEEIGLDPATANRAGLIRRTSGVALADAIIAATAIEAGRELITRNRKHFDRIDDLVVAEL